MPKKPVTTKRGQYHKFRSIRINLVKDATLEKIDSNILRNKPELFEKKKVTFEKKNADPLYFKETLCNEFPSLQGNEFSLWRLGCTNVKNETKTSLIPLPPEIDNAEALCECDELNRSCLYIKLQAAPSSYSVPSPQSHSDASASSDEDDSTPSLASSPKITSTAPDLLPSETYNQFQSVRQSIITFVEPSQNGDEHHNQSLVTHPWLTDTNQIDNQPLLMPLVTSVALNQETFTAHNLSAVDLEHLTFKMPPKGQASSTRDSENRHPKKRKIPPDSANNFESTEYTDVNDPHANDTDKMNEPKQNKNSQFMSLGLVPNGDTATFYDADGQQPVAFNFTAALLSDTALTHEIAQQSRTMDIGYLHPTPYPNPSAFVNLQNSGNETSNRGCVAVSNNSFGEPLTVTSLPSLLYNVTGTSGLQDNAQQWGGLNFISNNPEISWHQNRHIQTADSLRTYIGEVAGTNCENRENLITKHREFLVDRMDPDFGLLDVLIASKDLTMAEFHQIRSQPSTIEDRNQKLLQYMIDKNKADNFAAALEKTGQKHLVNYLKSDGSTEFEEEYHELWPLPDLELEKLITNRQTLIDGLYSPDLGFKLYFKEVVNKRQHEYILSKPTNPEKNEALLEMIRRGSIKQYKQTLDVLRELKQDHILKILQRSREEVGDRGYEEINMNLGLVGQQRLLDVKRRRLEEIERQRREAEERQRQEEVERQRREDEEHNRLHGLTATIRTKAAEEKNKPINGLAILDNELFVVSRESSEVEVYDSMKFSFSRQWTLRELINPYDIVSCHINKCLYISDTKVNGLSKEIFRVDPSGNLIKKWSTKIDSGQLSVAYDSNVILAAYHKNKLNEYSPDGQFIREIHLSSEEGFCHLRHAIKLTNGHFVVCQGGYDAAAGDLHRVCIVDADGKLLKSFGEKRGSTIKQTHGPAYLSVDGSGSVMVADYRNHIVLSLDSNLEFKKIILSYEHGLQYPHRILLDESNGRIFVSNLEQNNSRIMIFDLGQLKQTRNITMNS